MFVEVWTTVYIAQTNTDAGPLLQISEQKTNRALKVYFHFSFKKYPEYFKQTNDNYKCSY